MPKKTMNFEELFNFFDNHRIERDSMTLFSDKLHCNSIVYSYAFIILVDFYY